MPAVQQYRNVASALVARAMLRLNDGKADTAWSDLLACHRLARLVGQGPTEVEALVATTVDGIAFTGDQGLLQHVKLTAAQAAKMRSDLAELPAMPKMVNRINMDGRFNYLDSVLAVPRDRHFSLAANLKSIQAIADSQSLGDAKIAGMVHPLLDNMGDAAVDWDVVLRMGNAWCDRLVAAYRESSYAERKKAIGQIENDLNSMAGRAKNAEALRGDCQRSTQGGLRTDWQNLRG